MIIIGEKLNSSIPKTLEAIQNRNEDYIISLITEQEKGGADFLDVNTALCRDDELSAMKWIISLILKHSTCNIMLDSPSPSVIIAAAESLNGRKAIINSVTITDRFDEIVPFAKSNNFSVVGLPISGHGVALDFDTATANIDTLVEKLQSSGIKDESIFVDVLVQSLAVESDSAKLCLSLISYVKQKYPLVNTTCGLSNISFGLPQRININTTFLTAAVLAGLSSAIMDSTSVKTITALKSALAISGEDEYCIDYINHIRNAKC